MNNTHPAAQKFANTAKSGIQAFQEMADVVFNASEQIVNLNLEAARSMCAFASSQAAPMTKPDLQANLADRAQAHNDGIERATQYLRNVSDVYLRTQTEMAEVSARHFNEVNESMQSLFGEVARMAPLTGTQLFALPAFAAPAKRSTTSTRAAS